MIAAIRSNPILLAVLFLALAAQIPHAQTVFYDASHSHGTKDWWFALLFAIALESAVLMFVAHGWQRFSYVFAISSVLINMAYYAMLPAWFVKVLVSLILPLAIACYSHLLAHDTGEEINAVGWLKQRLNKQEFDEPSEPTFDDLDEEDEQPFVPVVDDLDEGAETIPNEEATNGAGDVPNKDAEDDKQRAERRRLVAMFYRDNEGATYQNVADSLGLTKGVVYADVQWLDKNEIVDVEKVGRKTLVSLNGKSKEFLADV